MFAFNNIIIHSYIYISFYKYIEHYIPIPGNNAQTVLI